MYKRITGQSIEVSFEIPWECLSLPEKFTITNNILDLKSKLIYIRQYRDLLKVVPFENTQENTKMVLSRVDGKPLIDKYEDFGGDVSATIEEKFMNDAHGINVYEEIVAFRGYLGSTLDTVYDRTILKQTKESGDIEFYLVVKGEHTKLNGFANTELAFLKESFKLVHLKNYEQLKHSLSELNKEVNMQKGWVEVDFIKCQGFPNQLFRGEWSVYKHLHEAIKEDSMKDIEEVFEWNVKAIKDMNGEYAYALNSKGNERMEITNVMFVGHLLIEDSEYRNRSMSYHEYNIYQSLGFIKEVHPSELLTYAKSEIEKAQKKTEKKKAEGESFPDKDCLPPKKFASKNNLYEYSRNKEGLPF